MERQRRLPLCLCLSLFSEISVLISASPAVAARSGSEQKDLDLDLDWAGAGEFSLRNPGQVGLRSGVDDQSCCGAVPGSRTVSVPVLSPSSGGCSPFFTGRLSSQYLHLQWLERYLGCDSPQTLCTGYALAQPLYPHVVMIHARHVCGLQSIIKGCIFASSFKPQLCPAMPSYAQRRPERPVPAGRQSVPQQLEPAID
ncbi:hypothetical protein M440DRAFT_1448530 [Trichoderma longibrachiatum ATCC 18648]|uniref:Hydrophobin n=1 Tax=Trichoderma longibrachiatum ATCC 18648 TaxID=983965 RepID=A0A2T4BT84_TRILO|nr:hypothetical protein M440DRAFT_1448530 [Trichoderma longibrachiatum ATCC 18648]